MPKRRASKQVTLVLSGALSLTMIQGCGNDPGPPALQVQPLQGTNTVTNNTYHASHGYYHAPAHTWYPYPWGHHDPTRGYFYGGQWRGTANPAPPAISESKPMAVAKLAPSTSHSSSRSSTFRGGFGSSGRSVIS